VKRKGGRRGEGVGNREFVEKRGERMATRGTKKNLKKEEKSKGKGWRTYSKKKQSACVPSLVTHSGRKERKNEAQRIRGLWENAMPWSWVLLQEMEQRRQAGLAQAKGNWGGRPVCVDSGLKEGKKKENWIVPGP